MHRDHRWRAGRIGAGQRQRQQQGRQELAGDITAHPDFSAGVQRTAGRAVQRQRRKAVVAEVIDAAAELAQRVHQVANRPLVHARHAA